MQAYLLGAKNMKSVQFCDLCSSVILPLTISLFFVKAFFLFSVGSNLEVLVTTYRGLRVNFSCKGHSTLVAASHLSSLIIFVSLNLG